MGDIIVDQSPQAPHTLSGLSSIAPESTAPDAFGQDGDQYAEYKRLQQELEYINLQEEYIKDEQRCALTHMNTLVECSAHSSILGASNANL